MFNIIINRLQKSSLFSLGKNTLIYGVGNVVQKFLYILLLPLYTRFLSPADFGIVALLAIFAVIFRTISGLGLTNGIGRYIYYSQEESTSTAAIVWSPLLFTIVSSLLLLLLIVMLSRPLSVRLFEDERYYNLLILSACGAVTTNMALIGRAVLIMQKKAMLINVINIVQTAIGIVSGVILVAYMKKGVTGAITAQVITITISAIPILFISLSKYHPSFSFDMLKKQIKYSIPLAAGVLAFWFIDSSDRYMIKWFLNLSEVGLYNIGYQLGLGMLIIGSGFEAAWPPFYHQNNKEGKAQKYCINVITQYVSIGSFFAVGLSIISPLFVRVLTSREFYGAYNIIPFVVMAYFLKGIYSVLIMGVQVKNMTHLQLLLETTAAIVNVVGNILLIPVIGRSAAALTTLLSYSLMVAGSYRLMMKINPISYFPIGYIIKICLIAFCFSTTCWLNKYVDLKYYILLSGMIFILYGGILTFWGGYIDIKKLNGK